MNQPESRSLATLSDGEQIDRAMEKAAQIMAGVVMCVGYERDLAVGLIKLFQRSAAPSETRDTIEVVGVPVRTISIPLETALLVRKACLPDNPNKCRGWDPDALAAVRTYISMVEGAAHRHTGDG